MICFRTINNASNISTTFLAHVDGQRNMRTLPLPNTGSKGMCSIRRRKAPASAPEVTPMTNESSLMARQHSYLRVCSSAGLSFV